MTFFIESEPWSQIGIELSSRLLSRIIGRVHHLKPRPLHPIVRIRSALTRRHRFVNRRHISKEAVRHTLLRRPSLLRIIFKHLL